MVFLAGLQQNPQVIKATVDPQSAEIISDMLRKYAACPFLSGHIQLEVKASAGGQTKSQTVTTDFAVQAPVKFYLRQQRSEPGADTWLAVSDGKQLSYPAPSSNVVSQHEQLLEVFAKSNLPPKTIGQVYSIAAPGIGDRSIPLSIMIGWEGEKKRFKYKLYSISAPEVDQASGDIVITGWARDSFNPGSPPAAHYKMVISKDHWLKEYEEIANISPEGASVTEYAHVDADWKVSTSDTQKIDETLFTVPGGSVNN